MSKITQRYTFGDCLELMVAMPDDSVDFSFMDPPYNVGKDYGVYKDDRTPEEYLAWMAECIFEMRRISKRGIAVYVGSTLTRTFFNMIPDAKLIIIHKKAVGALRAKYVLQYHSLFVTAPPLKQCRDLWDDIRLPGEGYFFREPRPKHPGLTSIKLTKRIIETFTEKKDTVCDPFLGTGTTLRACRETGRNGIGYEIDPANKPTIETRAMIDTPPLQAYCDETMGW